MRKFKAILSVALVIAMLCTSFAFAISADAATTEATQVAADAKLQDNIQNGVILHAFCWSYADIEKNIPAIAAAGYSAVQTSPVQQPKDMNTSTDVSGQWWKLYQPVSFSIATNSWLGTKAQLKSLCDTAHKYGVKIICDIVSNHLGADGDAGVTRFAKEVQTFESKLWGTNGGTKGNQYVHQNFSAVSDSSVASVVTGCLTGCPDLNTGDTYIQQRVQSLLKECVDQGVDGFRFDAAKHIETPDDGANASQYWPNVLNTTTSYAKSTYNKNIFYYGEILNTPGAGRNIGSYTKLMSVTDNITSRNIRNGVKGHNASSASTTTYSVSQNAAKTVLWAESHDTYMGEDDNTTNISNSDIMKTWALVASRKDASALFFARPTGMSMGGAAVDTDYKSVAASEINKFHNNSVGKSEKIGYSGNFAYVARGTDGVVIVNTNGTSGSASVSGTGLANGSYKDMITGNVFTVSGGNVSGQIGSTGIAVVTQGSTTPYVMADQESQTFAGESIVVGLTLANATSGTYQLDNYTPVPFTGSPKIRLGKDYNYGQTFTLTLTATDGTNTSTVKYTYTKSQAASSGVYIIVPDSAVSAAKWVAPLHCYVYDEDTDKGTTVGGTTYKNAEWPGEDMKYDATLKAYYVQVNNNSCIASKKVSASSTTSSASTFNLAKSMNTRVILNDSAKSSGGKSQSNQFPSSSSKRTLDLGGVSHKVIALTGTPGSSTWATTTDKPGSSADVQATDVTKGNIATSATTAPTTASTAPTSTAQPVSTTQPTSASTEPTTSIPPVTVEGITYGDVNLDKHIDISDVTAIQKHLASLAPITGTGYAVADVDGNSKVNIKDATLIQMFTLQMSNTGKVGQAYTGESPEPTPTATQATQTMPSTSETPSVQATTQTPTTEPTTAEPTTTTEPTTTEPATDPVPAPETYTVYLKTALTWISSMGSEPYLYDNATGQSYLMERDLDAYPFVFTAEVPITLTDGVIYRYTAPLETPDAGYNQMNVSYSQTNNCYTLNSFPDGGQPDGIMGPYVPETPPAFSLSRLYVENDKGWNAVYLYGWGYGIDNSNTMDMTQIPGTNIWYIDLPEPIPDGVETFLLKDTPGAEETDWKNQTANVMVQEPYNCYKLSGSWTTYQE